MLFCGCSGTGSADETSKPTEIPTATPEPYEGFTNFDDYGGSIANWIDEIYQDDGTPVSYNGGGAEYLKNNNYVVDLEYSCDSLTIRGWLGFETEIIGMGYSIDGTEPVFLDDYNPDTTEDAVKGVAGSNATRFTVTVPVENLGVGTHTIDIVAKMADGKLVKMNGTYKAATMKDSIPYDGNVINTITYKTTYKKPVASANGEYYVRSVFKDESTEIGRYDTIEDAKYFADKNAQTGHVVFDKKGNVVYSTYSELVTTLMREGKWVADFVRTNGFTYGNASLNPGYNWANPDKPVDGSEKIVSCDRLVDWILWRAGYTDQRTSNGPVVHDSFSYDQPHTLAYYCESKGFIKITDVNELQAGDICFVSPGPNGRAGHVYMCAGPVNNGSGNYYRYDGGSNNWINTVQPGSSLANPNFLFAYRPV